MYKCEIFLIFAKLYPPNVGYMSQLIIPKNYKAALSLQQTEIAIKEIKDFFLSNRVAQVRGIELKYNA